MDFWKLLGWCGKGAASQRPQAGVGFTRALQERCIGIAEVQSVDKSETVLGSPPPVGVTVHK